MTFTFRPRRKQESLASLNQMNLSPIIHTIYTITESIQIENQTKINHTNHTNTNQSPLNINNSHPQKSPTLQISRIMSLKDSSRKIFSKFSRIYSRPEKATSPLQLPERDPIELISKGTKKALSPIRKSKVKSVQCKSILDPHNQKQDQPNTRDKKEPTQHIKNSNNLYPENDAKSPLYHNINSNINPSTPPSHGKNSFPANSHGVPSSNFLQYTPHALPLKENSILVSDTVSEIILPYARDSPSLIFNDNVSTPKNHSDPDVTPSPFHNYGSDDLMLNDNDSILHRAEDAVSFDEDFLSRSTSKHETSNYNFDPLNSTLGSIIDTNFQVYKSYPISKMNLKRIGQEDLVTYSSDIVPQSVRASVTDKFRTRHLSIRASLAESEMYARSEFQETKSVRTELHDTQSVRQEGQSLRQTEIQEPTQFHELAHPDQMRYIPSEQVYRSEMMELVEKHTLVVKKQQHEINHLKSLLQLEKRKTENLTSLLKSKSPESRMSLRSPETTSESPMSSNSSQIIEKCPINKPSEYMGNISIPKASSTVPSFPPPQVPARKFRNRFIPMDIVLVDQKQSNTKLLPPFRAPISNTRSYKSTQRESCNSMESATDSQTTFRSTPRDSSSQNVTRGSQSTQKSRDSLSNSTRFHPRESLQYSNFSRDSFQFSNTPRDSLKSSNFPRDSLQSTTSTLYYSALEIVPKSPTDINKWVENSLTPLSESVLGTPARKHSISSIVSSVMSTSHKPTIDKKDNNESTDGNDEMSHSVVLSSYTIHSNLTTPDSLDSHTGVSKFHVPITI
jgi:hypothetical protein